MSLFVFSMPTTPAEALNMLPGLRAYAVEVLTPSNRRSLFQKRKKLNAYYDKVILFANATADELQSDPSVAQLHAEWVTVATRFRQSKSSLQQYKDAMRESEDIVSLYQVKGGVHNWESSRAL